MDSNSDYKNAHISWVKATKTFTPKYPDDYKATTYEKVLASLYADNRVSQQMAYHMFMGDKIWFKKSHKISKEIDLKIQKLEPTPNGIWFVTVGFNHQTWTISKCDKVIQNVLKMKWIFQGKANFELYRENGEHPHCHFLIETNEPKSRILDKIFRPQYVKDLVLNRNFIDVKIATQVHHNYINLIKQENKMPFVEKDIVWRKKNEIPDYEKNWVLEKEQLN